MEQIFLIKVIPNSKINKLVEQQANNLKIKLTAPAIEGKSNIALIKFLSQYFKVAKAKINILAGQKSRQKKVKINS